MSVPQHTAQRLDPHASTQAVDFQAAEHPQEPRSGLLGVLTSGYGLYLNAETLSLQGKPPSRKAG